MRPLLASQLLRWSWEADGTLSPDRVSSASNRPRHGGRAGSSGACALEELRMQAPRRDRVSQLLGVQEW